jgi:hypothetical protein
MAASIGFGSHKDAAGAEAGRALSSLDSRGTISCAVNQGRKAPFSLDIGVCLIELPSTAHSAPQGCETRILEQGNSRTRARARPRQRPR